MLILAAAHSGCDRFSLQPPSLPLVCNLPYAVLNHAPELTLGRVACCFCHAFKGKPQKSSCLSPFFCSFNGTGITSQQGAEGPPNNTGSAHERELRGGRCECASGRKCPSRPESCLLSSAVPCMLTQAALEFGLCSSSERQLIFSACHCPHPPAFGRAEGD